MPERAASFYGGISESKMHPTRNGTASYDDLHETQHHRVGPGDCARPRRVRSRQRSYRQVRLREVREAIGDKFSEAYLPLDCLHWSPHRTP